MCIAGCTKITNFNSDSSIAIINSLNQDNSLEGGLNTDNSLKLEGSLNADNSLKFKDSLNPDNKVNLRQDNSLEQAVPAKIYKLLKNMNDQSAKYGISNVPYPHQQPTRTQPPQGGHGTQIDEDFSDLFNVTRPTTTAPTTAPTAAPSVPVPASKLIEDSYFDLENPFAEDENVVE